VRRPPRCHRRDGRGTLVVRDGHRAGAEPAVAGTIGRFGHDQIDPPVSATATLRSQSQAAGRREALGIGREVASARC